MSRSRYQALAIWRGEELPVTAMDRREPGVHAVKRKGGTRKADEDYTGKAL